MLENINVYAVYLHINLWHAFEAHYFFTNAIESDHGVVK